MQVHIWATVCFFKFVVSTWTWWCFNRLDSDFSDQCGAMDEPVFFTVTSSEDPTPLHFQLGHWADRRVHTKDTRHITACHFLGPTSDRIVLNSLNSLNLAHILRFIGKQNQTAIEAPQMIRSRWVATRSVSWLMCSSNNVTFFWRCQLTKKMGKQGENAQRPKTSYMFVRFDCLKETCLLPHIRVQHAVRFW